MRTPNAVRRDRRPELRRHRRVTVSWPVTVEAGERLFHLTTLNLSPFGAKVPLKEHLELGSPARLHLEPPGGRPMDVEAIVWRADDDGPVFFFIRVRADCYSFPLTLARVEDPERSAPAPRGDS